MAKSILRRVSKRMVILANLLVVLVYLAAVFVQFASPQQWPPLLFILGLLYPYLLALVLAFLIFWLAILKPAWALVSLTALLLTGNAVLNFFAVNFNTHFTETKAPGHIRIATWNVARFVEMIKNNNKGSRVRHKMLEQIKNQNADILCFQEFTSSLNPDWYDNISAVADSLHYPYHFFSHDWDGDSLYNGSIVFSRLPIIDSGMVRYPRPTLPEAMVYAQIKNGKDTFRVYTTHLQSNQFKKEDIGKIEALKAAKGNIWTNTFFIFSKLKTAYLHRSIHADVAGELLRNSPYPNLFCGDLNDVPNSYTYHTVRGNMQDAFLKKGWGIGRTYNSIAPTLRIDYIMADAVFDIKQFKRITTDYSDHYMLVADVALKK